MADKTRGRENARPSNFAIPPASSRRYGAVLDICRRHVLVIHRDVFLFAPKLSALPHSYLAQQEVDVSGSRKEVGLPSSFSRARILVLLVVVCHTSFSVCSLQRRCRHLSQFFSVASVAEFRKRSNGSVFCAQISIC